MFQKFAVDECYYQRHLEIRILKRITELHPAENHVLVKLPPIEYLGQYAQSDSESEYNNYVKLLVKTALLCDRILDYIKYGIKVVADATLRSELYRLTNGTPIYLDLCVDRYHNILENGAIPSINEIGSNVLDLIERFVRYMDDSKKDIVYLLSCINHWTDELLVEIANKMLPGFSFTTLEKTKDFSFVLTEDNINFVMHQTVSEALYKKCPDYIKTKSAELMETYFSDRIGNISPSEAAFETTLTQYINYKLTNTYSSEIFIKFYINKASIYIRKLCDSYQFAGLLRIYEILSEFSFRMFGKCTIAAGIYLDYSYKLSLAGDFNKALLYALDSFEYYRDILGDENPYTLAAMNSLTSRYIETGRYNEALMVAEKALELRKRIQGDEHQDTIVALNLIETLKKLT